MNGETFYNVFILGGLTFINPFSGWAPQRRVDSPALTLRWPTVAALQPITRRPEAGNDSKIGSGQHSTNMCFQTSAAQIPKYTQTLFFFVSSLVCLFLLLPRANAILMHTINVLSILQ